MRLEWSWMSLRLKRLWGKEKGHFLISRNYWNSLAIMPILLIWLASSEIGWSLNTPRNMTMTSFSRDWMERVWQLSLSVSSRRDSEEICQAYAAVKPQRVYLTIPCETTWKKNCSTTSTWKSWQNWQSRHRTTTSKALPALSWTIRSKASSIPCNKCTVTQLQQSSALPKKSRPTN